MTLRRLAVALLVVLALAGCGPDGTPANGTRQAVAASSSPSASPSPSPSESPSASAPAVPTPAVAATVPAVTVPGTTKAPGTTRPPAPRTTTKPAPKGPIVHPGAFCKPEGAIGYTSAGTMMRCTLKAGEKQPRWRAA